MDKRFLHALLLSMLVLFMWTWVFPPLPPEQGEVADGAAVGVSPGGGAEFEAAPQAVEPASSPPALSASDLEVTEPIIWGEPGAPGHFELVFSNEGGRLVSLRALEFFRPDTDQEPVQLLRSYEAQSGERSGSLLWGSSSSSADLAPTSLEHALWQMNLSRGVDSGEVVSVEFEYGPVTGLRLRKRVRPVPGTWDIAVELEIENTGGLEARPAVMFKFVPAGSVPWSLNDTLYREPNAVAVGGGLGDLDIDEATRDTRPGSLVGGLSVAEPLHFAGVHNKYFACLLRAEEGDERSARSLRAAGYRHLESVEWLAEHPGEPYDGIQAELSLGLEVPPPGEKRTWSYRLYCGPKGHKILADAFPPHERLSESDLGFFSGIGRLLRAVMGFFHGWTGNWGVAIILMTLCVRVILFPLNRRSQTAMARYQKKMKRVQPKLEELKKKYANDKKKLQQEQARFMQEEGAFPPLGGCLPPFLQIPVFFGLYTMLRTSFDLRQADFAFWIHDLSQPDRLLHLGIELPLLGGFLSDLNVLPLVMIVLWVLQQRGMPMPADEQAARMQKMMMWMPIVMGVVLYNYAAGLSLYMITQSGLGIIEQRVIKKMWPIDDTEVEAKKGGCSGCGPFAGMMENIAEKQREQMERLQAQQRAQKQAGGGSRKRRKKR